MYVCIQQTSKRSEYVLLLKHCTSDPLRFDLRCARLHFSLSVSSCATLHRCKKRGGWEGTAAPPNIGRALLGKRKGQSHTQTVASCAPIVCQIQGIEPFYASSSPTLHLKESMSINQLFTSHYHPPPTPPDICRAPAGALQISSYATSLHMNMTAIRNGCSMPRSVY